MIDDILLINVCRTVYSNHEKYGNVVLDNTEITQLNTILQTDTGNFKLAFPAPSTLVIYNDYFLIEYIHYPYPKIRAYSKPDKSEIERVKKGDLVPMKQIMSKQEFEERETKRKLMQARIFEKMGVHLHVEKDTQREKNRNRKSFD